MLGIMWGLWREQKCTVQKNRCAPQELHSKALRHASWIKKHIAIFALCKYAKAPAPLHLDS